MKEDKKLKKITQTFHTVKENVKENVTHLTKMEQRVMYCVMLFLVNKSNN